ncbi:spore coat protein [Moorella sp. ACPs]|uniref:spore coat protein n=1 Tax=Neomoorella carbonis TaxID=3062783 RepID=UPI003256381E
MAGLTQAELMQLRENLSNELLMIRKFGAYAAQCNDPQLKQVLSSVQQAHQRHYNTLIRHLGGQHMM